MFDKMFPAQSFRIPPREKERETERIKQQQQQHKLP